MSVVNREKFLLTLAKSEILGSETIEKWLAEVSPDVDSKKLARDLISKKLLTLWQAKMLLRGAWRLKFGNYLLTDRVEKSEFGDRFSATHPQLSRDVFIQYLPTEFSDSRELRKKVFSLGSQLSELDHPNLVHVYDVDEERDRVYLVSEVAEGRGLQELLAEPPSQSNASVARIIRGCLRGVSYAHSKDVVFGSVSKETVVVRPDGEPKICGLTRFAIRNELAESPAAASDDLAAVKSIAVSLLEAVAESERESDSFSKLKIAVSSIATDSKAATSMLDELVRLEDDSSSGSGDIKLAPESPRVPVTAHPAVATVRAESGGIGNDVSDDVEFEASEGFLTSVAKRNPVALIAASAVTALLLIGGTVFAATKLVGPTVADAGLELPGEVGVEDMPSASKKKNRRKKNGKASKAERPNVRNTQGALLEDAPNMVAGSVTDPNANLAAIDAIFNKGADAKPEPIEVVTSRSADAKPSPKATNGAAAVPAMAPKADMPSTEPPAQVAAMSPAGASKAARQKNARKRKAQEKAAQAAKANSGKGQPEYLEAGVDPFKKFVTIVELPDTSSTDQVSFGKLILEKRHLLGSEILSTPMVHRSKLMFEIARSSDDKQTWEISLKKKRKSPPLVVAKLQKTKDELKFNWLPEAADEETANYLRNCRVKISTPNHSHWLTLRKPIKIDDFKLAEDKGQVKVDCEIPYMPNLAALSATAGGINFKRLDDGNYKQKAHLAPAEITANSPARMYFHDLKSRYLSLDVGIGLRKKVTLQAALVMQSQDQAPVVLEDPRAIKQVGLQIRQAAQQAKLIANQAKQALSQKKIQSDEEKVYAAAARKAEDQAKHTEYYEHVVPQLVEKEIPVTITYALSDQHRIILAYTKESADTKKK